MQALHEDNLSWESGERGVREAEVFSIGQGQDETRIDIVEVPSGGFIPAHRHSRRREFITILLSAGAQMQIGERVFRPTAGQVFHREPQEILAITNDSHHPLRYSVARFSYSKTDVEWMTKTEENSIAPSAEEDEAPEESDSQESDSE